jgi:DNA-binding XRE family transcriptional regulator
MYFNLHQKQVQLIMNLIMLFMKNKRLRQSIHSKANTALRNLLITQRKKLQLTQRELAERLNISHSIIGKIETGDRRLDIVELLEYAHALEIDTMDIINIIQETQSYPTLPPALSKG